MSSIHEKLSSFCSNYPQIQYSIKNGIFHISQPNEDGFPISVFIGSDEFTIEFGEWHGHFDTEEEVLGIVEFGLSERCRLQVLSSGGSPYRWIVESFHEAGWVHEYSTGFFAWRFWLPKSCVFLQNHCIPAP